MARGECVIPRGQLKELLKAQQSEQVTVAEESLHLALSLHHFFATHHVAYWNQLSTNETGQEQRFKINNRIISITLNAENRQLEVVSAPEAEHTNEKTFRVMLPYDGTRSPMSVEHNDATFTLTTTPELAILRAKNIFKDLTEANIPSLANGLDTSGESHFFIIGSALKGEKVAPTNRRIRFQMHMLHYFLYSKAMQRVALERFKRLREQAEKEHKEFTLTDELYAETVVELSEKYLARIDGRYNELEWEKFGTTLAHETEYKTHDQAERINQVYENHGKQLGLTGNEVKKQAIRAYAEMNEQLANEVMFLPLLMAIQKAVVLPELIAHFAKIGALFHDFPHQVPPGHGLLSQPEFASYPTANPNIQRIELLALLKLGYLDVLHVYYQLNMGDVFPPTKIMNASAMTVAARVVNFPVAAKERIALKKGDISAVRADRIGKLSRLKNGKKVHYSLHVGREAIDGDSEAKVTDDETVEVPNAEIIEYLTGQTQVSELRIFPPKGPSKLRRLSDKKYGLERKTRKTPHAQNHWFYEFSETFLVNWFIARSGKIPQDPEKQTPEDIKLFTSWQKLHARWAEALQIVGIEPLAEDQMQVDYSSAEQTKAFNNAERQVELYDVFFRRVAAFSDVPEFSNAVRFALNEFLCEAQDILMPGRKKFQIIA